MRGVVERTLRRFEARLDSGVEIIRTDINPFIAENIQRLEKWVIAQRKKLLPRKINHPAIHLHDEMNPTGLRSKVKPTLIGARGIGAQA